MRISFLQKPNYFPVFSEKNSESKLLYTASTPMDGSWELPFKHIYQNFVNLKPPLIVVLKLAEIFLAFRQFLKFRQHG